MNSRNLFLSKVLAPEGLYCVVGLKKGIPKQSFVNTVEELDQSVDQLVAEGYDAYFGCAKFETSDGRTAKNAKWFKSFWLDLDCGEGKEYDTQESALIGLKNTCIAAGLSKPTIINSGRGIHAYWILEEAIGYNDWKPVAEGLKKLCVTHELYADPTVTADAARILRVPNTLNFKNSTNPYEVSIFKDEISEPISFENFKNRVGIVEVTSLPKRPIDATTRALLGNNVSKFATIMIKSINGTGCPQLSYIYNNQANVPEPLWRSGLSIAQHCEDRDTAIHRLSNKHPDYTARATQEKAEGIPGPHTCATFEKTNPTGCYN